MNLLRTVFRFPTARIALVALVIVAFDQMTKSMVLKYLGYAQEKVILPGFFKFVHWGNTGAAWSLFRGNNDILAVVAVVALVVLFLSRRHFNSDLPMGQAALGLIFGGIIGNLIDRLTVNHVIDFLYFYVHVRGGGEMGFPAFNVADSAICAGVALVFIITWRADADRRVPPPEPAGPNSLENAKP